MALDEPNDNDNQVEAGGLTYLIDKELADQVGSVTVDFTESGWKSGFSVSSEKPVSSGPSECGGSCSC